MVEMRKANRGRAATASNRAALMKAARAIFAREGINSPLSAIAREAGVSQGVLYRHFPSRIELAVAVFEENMDAIAEAIDGKHDGELAFDTVWRTLVELTMSDVAFIQTAVHDSEDTRIVQFGIDIRDMLQPLVDEARQVGRVGPEITGDFLFIALRAIYGLVTSNGARMGPVDESVGQLLKQLGIPVRQRPI